MKLSKLTKLVLDEISAVDRPASELDGFMIMKARATKHPTTGRFQPATTTPHGGLPGVKHNDNRHVRVVLQ